MLPARVFAPFNCTRTSGSALVQAELPCRRYATVAVALVFVSPPMCHSIPME